MMIEGLLSFYNTVGMKGEMVGATSSSEFFHRLFHRRM